MLSHYRRWIPAPFGRENDGDIKSPSNSRRLCRRRGLPFSAINRRLRFRANSKMAKGWIPAVARMTIEAALSRFLPPQAAAG